MYNTMDHIAELLIENGAKNLVHNGYYYKFIYKDYYASFIVQSNYNGQGRLIVSTNFQKPSIRKTNTSLGNARMANIGKLSKNNNTEIYNLDYNDAEDTIINALKSILA